MYSLARTINKFFKSGMYDYCQIETVDDYGDGKILVTKEGGLMTIFEISGSYGVVGEDRFRANVENFMNSLSGALSKPGYKLQFVFTRDAESSHRDVEASIDPMINTVQRLEMDVLSMIEERKELLSKKTSAERCYLVVTTLPSILPPANAKEAMKDRIDEVKDLGVGIKPGEFGQSPFWAIAGIRESHWGMIGSVSTALKEVVEFKILEAHDAIRAVRMEVNPGMTSSSWRPNLVGDKIPARATRDSGLVRDTSYVMNPDVSFQIFTQEPQISAEDGTIVEMGSKFYAPLLVDIPPQNPASFSRLFDSIKEDIPWRWSYTITTGHDQVKSKVGNRHTFATFLAFTSGQNKLIKAAAEELMALAEGGEILVMGNMSICTWGETVKEARKRKQVVSQAMQNWGQMDVIDEKGDPIEAWCNTLPAMSAKEISNAFPIPLFDSLLMAPLVRPTSPWEQGSILLRTVDNKLFPNWPGSRKQTSWTDLVFAPPGFGKSFYLAAANMALITQPGNSVLPRIAIIDIGFSSAAFVDLVKASLPDHKKHLAQSFKLKMTNEYAINPFDTPLGCRYPLSVDKEFLTNFLTLVLTPAGRKEPVDRLTELVSSVIEAMYDYMHDDNNPQRYDYGIQADVDKTLEDLGFHYEDGETTWWEVVDYLFANGYYVLASKAQRYAVPTLADMTQVMSSDQSIKDIYGGAEDDSNLIGYVNSMIVSAVKDYPILSQPSAFDIGAARIASVDLSDVAKSGSDKADKTTGIMYMLARQVLCREFYRGDENINEIPEAYKAYHQKIIDQDSTVPKKICMDEFHRTRSSPSVRNQAVVDIREGRKFNVHIALLSQMIDDFDSAMIELSTNIYILSKGISEDTITKINDKFRPSSDAMAGLRRYLTGPGPEGSSMLYLGSLKGSKSVEQIVRLTLGPTEVWAYSTTHADVIIRKKLTARVGLNNALKILATEYPGGSAAEYIETRNRQAGDHDDGENIFELISDELITKHKNIIGVH